MAASPVVHTCDEHSSVYFHLAADGARGLALTHLDAHCDLRGTLIDRETGIAWMRKTSLPVSGSTYLSHLVAERIIGDVDWVHDEVGGRDNDLFTVLYTEDLDRFAYRLVRRPAGPGVVLAYREAGYAAWRHRDPDRILDIDWDFFADWRKPQARTSREIEELLGHKLEVAPRRVYVAYSPHYSRPDRVAYNDFVDRLARRLSARVAPIPEAPAPRAGALARALPQSLRRLLRASALRAKRVLVR
jgi:hypothetical protein